MRIKVCLFLILPLLLLTLLITSVSAIGRPQDVDTHPNIIAQQNGRANVQNGTSRTCQARESAIKNRSTHLTQLATDMETKFASISARVEDYYSSKVVPSGKTVADYDNLVADIAAKKTAVQTALTKAQSDASNFTCTTGNPKTQLTQFRNDMQAVKSALKDYRTSIKNLIVAVHSVTGTENSESPKP